MLMTVRLKALVGPLSHGRLVLRERGICYASQTAKRYKARDWLVLGPLGIQEAPSYPFLLAPRGLH